jgi:hypothetical protein
LRLRSLNAGIAFLLMKQNSLNALPGKMNGRRFMQRRLEKHGTQQDTVKAALLAGMRLNHAMLIKAYGGNKAWRLGGIVWALQNDKKEPLLIDRTYSGANRMATYWLAQGEKPSSKQMGLPL